jgi:epoxyqueuosine reductase
MTHPHSQNLALLTQEIKDQGKDLGFQDIRISKASPEHHSKYLKLWLDNDFHGNMSYMKRNLSLRETPEKLHPGVQRVISLRYNYLSSSTEHLINLFNQPNHAVIAQYAQGRDYHKLLRKKLSKICAYITHHSNFENHRAFADSAPILERAFAEQSGLGWIGKNTMLINAKAGSWFFLAEILTDAPLPIDSPQETSHCGTCSACISICPTQAIIEPWKLDARKCISYLTIENKESIPIEYRAAIGNRVFGCDDCQIICPWNKFAQTAHDINFKAHSILKNSSLLELFNWDENTFLENTAGTPIRRIGYTFWLRNLSVALGNAPYSKKNLSLLNSKETSNPMLLEHFAWAIEQQLQKKNNINYKNI